MGEENPSLKGKRATSKDTEAAGGPKGQKRVGKASVEPTSRPAR